MFSPLSHRDGVGGKKTEGFSIGLLSVVGRYPSIGRYWPRCKAQNRLVKETLLGRLS